MLKLSDRVALVVNFLPKKREAKVRGADHNVTPKACILQQLSPRLGGFLPASAMRRKQSGQIVGFPSKVASLKPKKGFGRQNCSQIFAMLSDRGVADRAQNGLRLQRKSRGST